MKKKFILALCIAVLFAGCSWAAVQEISETPQTSAETQTSEEVKEALGTIQAEKPVTETTAQTTSETEISKISDEELSQIDNTKVNYGQGVQFDSENRPAGALDFNSKYEKYNAYALFENAEDTAQNISDSKDASSKTICLTFDLGYEAGYTGQILDTLKEKDVKAIFFITGGYVRYADSKIIQRMIDEGHVLGNHGYNHKSLQALLETSIPDAEKELDDCEAMVKEKFGYQMKYMRPPEGVFSERALALAQRMGYTTLLYSFAYKDWETNNQPDPQYALEKITAHPHDGEIMLLHGVSKTNADILPKIIDNLREQGFEFKLPSV